MFSPNIFYRTKYKGYITTTTMKLSKYLQKLQNKESVFPMDSIEKKKKIIRTVYPEQKNEAITPRIMIDFDQTIHSFDQGWQDGVIYGDVIEGTREAINFLKEKYEIVIFTARLSKIQTNIEQRKREIENWLHENDVYFNLVTADKLPAHFYIDDKAIRFEGNWDDILTKIEKYVI